MELKEVRTELKLVDITGGEEIVYPGGESGSHMNDLKDQEVWTIEGLGSTFGNIDLGGDRIMPGAFTESLQDTKVRFLWQHMGKEPIGRIIQIEENTQGLYFKAIMPKEDSFLRDRVVPQLRIGALDSFSIGYITIEDRMDGDIRELLKIMLLEISLATIPMNPEAVMTDFKNHDGKILSKSDVEEMSERQFENFLRDGARFSSSAAKAVVSYRSSYARDAQNGSAARGEILSSLKDITNNFRERGNS